jgi:mannitol-1-phosphate 5-dehydrogenase
MTLKTFIQYGAGNIGRGFIGALFSEAGYQVKFIDVNKAIIDALNSQKSYEVDVVSLKGNYQIEIKNVCGIDGMNTALVADAISDADLMATAVGVNVLPGIVPNIIEGLRKRWSDGNKKPLNIIICENLIDADAFLRKLIREKLTDEEKTLFDSNVGLVEASIGRMVPVMAYDPNSRDCLHVKVEKYGYLPIDQSAFIGEIPKIQNLYPFSPFEYFIRRKLYIHNMSHALIAYCGYLEKYNYIWESSENSCIKLLVQRAMIESARALSKKYTVPLECILEHIDDLLLRFGNRELGDTVARVGRDTRRKLSARDRFAGAIKLCESLSIAPVYICVGIAAGLLFVCDADEGTKAVNELLQDKGIDAVLTEICGFDLNSISAKYVKEYYMLLKSGASIENVFALCESFEAELLDSRNIV